MAPKLLTEEHIQLVRSRLIKALALQVAIDPALKEILQGTSIDIQVVQVPNSQARSHIDQYMPKIPKRTLIEVKPLPPNNGRNKFYLKATLAGGKVMEVSQHKSITGALRAKTRLEKHGVAIESILRAQLEANNAKAE